MSSKRTGRSRRMGQEAITENTLFYGDNLNVLREYIANECVDLIYLDPPFNSSCNYNVLFKNESGFESEAQIKAFEDTWHWSHAALETYYDLVQDSTNDVSKMIGALHEIIGENQMMAYLVMMTVRLRELHRVLKPTGSLYLHCDSSASHYLKIILDTIFGVENFRNEIIWKRQTAHSDAKTKYSDVTDTMLFYAKSKHTKFIPQYVPHDQNYIHNFYRHDDNDGRGPYSLDNMASPNPRPHMMYEWMGFPWPQKGWRYQRETMQKLHDEGRVWYPKRSDGSFDTSKRPRLKRYLAEQEGSIITNVWTDIQPLHDVAGERLGYPTQKPLALLERIISTSSQSGDVILDPFCGCGTAIVAAEKLGRRWAGIDVTHLSIALLKYRLEDMFSDVKYQVVGEPHDVEGARQLANEDRYQFQWWALSLVRAKPLGGREGSREGKEGSDRGIDGVKNFVDDHTGQRKTVVVQVKSGTNVNVSDIRDLRGTVEREKAAIGVFLTLYPPTEPMKKEAMSALFYQASFAAQKYPKIQILTIADLLRNNAQIQMPTEHGTFKQAPRVRDETEAYQEELFATD